MLPLSANSDFKTWGVAKGETSYRDFNANIFSSNAEVYRTEAIDQAIGAVIATEPFERIFNPEFYSPFYKLIFSNDVNVDEIMSEVFDRIETWVNVTVLREDTDVKVDSANHEVSLKIPYMYNNGQNYHVFSKVING